MLSNSHRAATLAAWKTLARDVAADGVTVNTLLPGRIATDRLATNYGSLDAAEEASSGEVPAGRLGRPRGDGRRRSVPLLRPRGLHHRRRAARRRRAHPVDLSTPNGTRTRDLRRERPT